MPWASSSFHTFSQAASTPLINLLRDVDDINVNQMVDWEQPLTKYPDPQKTTFLLTYLQ